MKKILYIGVLAITGMIVLLTSCSKKLDEYNPSGLTASTVFTTAVDFETLVNAAYAYNR